MDTTTGCTVVPTVHDNNMWTTASEQHLSLLSATIVLVKWPFKPGALQISLQLFAAQKNKRKESENLKKWLLILFIKVNCTDSSTLGHSATRIRWNEEAYWTFIFKYDHFSILHIF
jgi:hypothetical protein